MSTRTGAEGLANLLVQEGEYWCVRLGGRAFQLKDSKGLRYLAVLFAHPGVDFHALDLAAGASAGRCEKLEANNGLKQGRLGDAGTFLDHQAKAAYRQRIEDLCDDLEQAEAFNDPERAARARVEIDFIARELAAAAGLNGRDRRAASSSERARVSVTRAIRSALARIAANDRALGDYLAAAIKTGTFCSYHPHPELEAALLASTPSSTARAAPGAASGGHEPLLERERELALLDDLVARVPHGGSATVAFQAPAGMGKSALLARAERAAASGGLIVLKATGGELERDLAFGVVLQLYEPLVQRETGEGRDSLLAGAAALSTPLLAPERGASLPDAAAEAAVFHGLFWLTANLADRAPVLVVVDDAHWLDVTSARYLAYLARRVTQLPAGICLAMRPAEAGAATEALDTLTALPTTTLVRPAPLTDGATAKLVRAELQDADDDTCLEVHRASGGNPFFVRELAAALAERGRADPGELAAHTTEGVARAVRRRLQRLSPPARALAHAAAVLGREVDLRRAALVARLGASDAAAAADELVDHEILNNGRRPAFRHPLERTAIYEALPDGRRSDMHCRAARLLWGEDAASDVVAAHLLATDRRGDGWLTTVLREAAKRAGDRGAPDVAARYLERALEEPPPAADRADTLLALGLARSRAGITDADEPIASSLALSHDPATRARTALLLGEILVTHGRGVEAVAHYDSALAELGGATPELRIELEAAAAMASWFHRDLWRVAGERLDRLGPPPPGHTRTERTLLAVYAMQMFNLVSGTSEEVATLARRALAGGRLLEEQGAESPAFFFAADLVGLTESVSESDEWWARGAEDARRRGSIGGYALASMFLSHTTYRTRDVFEAVALAQDALELVGALDLRGHPGWGYMFLADALLDAGDLRAASAALDAGFHETPEDSYGVGLLYSRLCRLRLAQGDPRSALDAIERCGAYVHEWDDLNPAGTPYRALSAITYACLGDQARARELAEADLDLARRFGASRGLGAALRGCGLSTTGARRLDYLGEAVDILRHSGERLEHVRLLVDLGCALREQGFERDGCAALQDALRGARALNARALAAAARRELAAAGQAPPASDVDAADALTPRERRVVRLARRMTAREIAQALFLPPETIEARLASAQRKLGVPALREVVAVEPQGLVTLASSG